MNALKDLRINGLKNLKINGFKFLKVNELKHLIPKPEDQDDMELEDLIKSKKEVEIKIRKLLREKKGLESRIEKKELESRIGMEGVETRLGKLQKIKNEESEEMSEFPWREEIFPPLSRKTHHEVSRSLEVETGALQKEDVGISEMIDNQIVIKVEDSNKSLESKETGEIEEDNTIEIEVKEEVNCASKKNGVKSNEESDVNNVRKKAGEIAFPENTNKSESVEAALKDNNKSADEIPALEDNEKQEDKTPEKRKTKNENAVHGIFGNILIQELLESEELCPEEEQNFVKYIGESSVLELVTNLRELKSLLAEAGP